MLKVASTSESFEKLWQSKPVLTELPDDDDRLKLLCRIWFGEGYVQALCDDLEERLKVNAPSTRNSEEVVDKFVDSCSPLSEAQ